jgi:hypothetical protein
MIHKPAKPRPWLRRGASKRFVQQQNASKNSNNAHWFQELAVEVIRDECAWLVRYRKHGWLHSSLRAAVADAEYIAAGFEVGILVRFQ